MSDMLTILHLEDSNLDVELIRETICRQWPDCRILLADTEAGFVQALEQGGVDLILADYSLPHFSGMDALLIARKRFSEIPFIFVSGVMGEEVAIESLKSGATDYVLKNRLSRLAPSISRALRERDEELKRKQAEAALAEKQQQLVELNISLEQRIAASVAELRSKDQMLIQQSRQAATAHLMRNIAHHWRQPLNNIGLSVQNLQVSQDAGQLTSEEMTEQSRLVLDILHTLSQTINDFSSFFRPDDACRQFSINQTIAKALDFMGPTLQNDVISVSYQEQADLTLVGYPNQLLQALLSIIANAAEVLHDRKTSKPRIEIAVSRQDDQLALTVSDNAGGIAPTALPWIFDPYFTTKEVGKGAGLGLYMAKLIIEKNMNGTLTVQNSEHGAVFRIDLSMLPTCAELEGRA